MNEIKLEKRPPAERGLLPSEAAELVAERDELRGEVDRLREVIREIGSIVVSSCSRLHHREEHQHGLVKNCPAAARLDELLAEATKLEEGGAE